MLRFADQFARGLPSKVFAVAAAVGLWSYVNLRGAGQEVLEATVRFQSVRPDLEVNPDQIERVAVVLRGPRERLRALGAKGLVATVDCAGVYRPGETTVNVDAATLDLPRGVEFVKAVPSQLRFSFSGRAEKEVEVAPQFVGEIAAGYVLDGYTVDPPTLVVAGPSERVALVEQVSTDPIDLAGEVGHRSFRATAFVADPYLRFPGNPTVVVEVRMRKR